MAFAMTLQGQSSVLNWTPLLVAGKTVSIADTSFTTSATATTTQTLAFGATKFVAVIYLKTYVTGTQAVTGGTFGCWFYLEGADDSGMSTNLTVLGNPVMCVNVASSTEVQCFVLYGLTPVASKAYARVKVDPTLQTGTIAGTFDTQLSYAP